MFERLGDLSGELAEFDTKYRHTGIIDGCPIKRYDEEEMTQAVDDIEASDVTENVEEIREDLLVRVTEASEHGEEVRRRYKLKGKQRPHDESPGPDAKRARAMPVFLAILSCGQSNDE